MKKLVIGFCFAALGLAVGAAVALGWTVPTTLPELRPSLGWIFGLGVLVAVLNDLALALARVGRRDEARETIRRARTADPGNEHIRATEAEIGAK